MPYGDKVWANVGSSNGLLPYSIQTNTWTNVDLSSMGFWGIHMRDFPGNNHDINLYDEVENYISKMTALSPLSW